MNTRNLKIVFVIFYLWLAPCRSFPQQISRVVGRLAPPLKVYKWLKGTPITGFEKGQVYIVEFTGAGCSACQAFMPHLSSLARKYSQQAAVISIYVRQNGIDPKDFTDTSYVNKTRRYVESMGEMMSYHVAIDDPEQTMVNSWMKVSGILYIPSVWVINRSGKVSWIGNAHFLEPVMQKVIQNSFTGSEVKAQEHKEKLYQERMNDALNDKGDAGVTRIDSLIAEYPDHPPLYVDKFKILLEKDEDSAYLFVRDILDNKYGDIEISALLPDMAQIIIRKENDLRNPDWDLVIQMMDRAAEHSQLDRFSAYIFSTQADAYAKKKNYPKAIETQRKAILFLKDGDTQDAARMRLQEKLAQYMNSAQ